MENVTTGTEEPALATIERSIVLWSNRRFDRLCGNEAVGQPLRAILPGDAGWLSSLVEGAGSDAAYAVGAMGQEVALGLALPRGPGQRLLVVAPLPSSQGELGAFLRVASHELKGPLSAATTRMELARRQARGSGVEEAIAAAISSLRRLSRTVNNLDELGLPVLGSPFEEAIDLRAMLEPLVADLALVSRRSIVLEHGDSVAAAVDAGKLEQAVSNLVANAVKYSEPPAPILVRIRRTGGGAAIEVEDRGIGIPPEDLARLAQRHGRGSNVGGRPGLGLGLFVSSQLVSSMGGSLEVRSALGSGSVFTIVLPAAEPA